MKSLKNLFLISLALALVPALSAQSTARRTASDARVRIRKETPAVSMTPGDSMAIMEARTASGRRQGSLC